MDIQYLLKRTMQLCGEISLHENIEMTPERRNAIIEKMKVTYKEKLEAILQEVRKDSREADFFGGLEKGKIPALSMTAGKISLLHGLTMYAKFLIDETTPKQ